MSEQEPKPPNKVPSRIPDFKSVEEEAEFWETHDITDFLDELWPVRVRFSPNLSIGEEGAAWQEPLDEVERELMDPDTWDWESAEEGGPSPDPHLIFRVRLSGEDIKRIEAKADAHRMRVGEFLRYTALKWISQQSNRQNANHDALAVTKQ